MKPLTAPEIVAELDRVIIGQERAKRAVAVALRNRWRLQRAHLSDRDDSLHHYLLGGPRGVGKSTLALHAARAIDAPIARISALDLARNGAVEKLFDALIEETALQVGDTERAEQEIERSGILLIDHLELAVAVSDENREDRSTSSQHPLHHIMHAKQVSTRYGTTCTGHMLIFATINQLSGNPGDLTPDIQTYFPRRIELDSLNEDDLLNIVTNTETPPARYYATLLASEGLTVQFSPTGLHAVAREADELNRRIEDIGARRIALVVEHVLDELLFNPAGVPGSTITIDDDYVSARMMVDGDDEDLTDLIL